MLRYELTPFKKYLVEEYLNQNVFIQTAVNDVVEEFNDIEQKLIRQLNKEGLKINYNELLNVAEYLHIDKMNKKRNLFLIKMMRFIELLNF